MALMDSIENNAGNQFADIFQFSGNLIRESVFDVNRAHFSGFMWVACLDYSTCLVCASLDGKVWANAPDDEQLDLAFGEGVMEGSPPEQPIHPNCRCVMVPVLKGMEKDYTSAPNYADWLSRRTDNELIDILGPAKANLYKSGVPIERFIRDERVATFNDLGIKRLERKEALELMAEQDGSIGSWDAKDFPEYEKIYTDKMTSQELLDKFKERNPDIKMEFPTDIQYKHGVRMVVIETDRFLKDHPIYSTLEKIRMGTAKEMESYDKDAVGIYLWGTKEIVLHPDRVFVPKLGQRTLIHEFAHALRRDLIDKGKFTIGVLIGYIKQKYEVDNWREIAGLISTRAIKDESELFSEGFEVFYNKRLRDNERLDLLLSWFKSRKIK